MKKLIYCAAALATVLFAGSCNKELETALGGDSHVIFTVSTDEVATKADIADGTNVDALHWEIYLTANADTAPHALGKGVVVDKDGNKTFTVDLKLVADQEYSIIFWAQKMYNEDGTNPYYEVSDLRKVKIDYAVGKGTEHVDDEDRAAFFAVHKFNTKNGPVNETVDLKRPFAQLNLGATNLETSLNNVNGGVIIIESTDITVKNVAKSFDTLDGKGEDQTALTYKRERTPYYDYKARHLVVNKEAYHWLSMNYLAVYGDADNVALDIKVNTTVGTVQHSIDNVPVKENHRTNILGDLLTTASSFQVIVDEEFDKPDLGAVDILKNTLAKGGEFTLLEDMTINESLVVGKGVKAVINLNGKTITNQKDNKSTDVIVVDEEAELEINGPGNITAVSGNDGYPVFAWGKVTINGGVITSGVDEDGNANAGVYVKGKGAAYIKGGEYHSEGIFTLNKYDSHRAQTVIEVTGGTFYDWNPADNEAEGKGTDFVAEGYESVETAAGSNVWVVKPVKK